MTDQPEMQKRPGIVLELPAVRRPAASRFVRPATALIRSNFMPGQLALPQRRQPGLHHQISQAGYAYRGRLPKPANDAGHPAGVFASKFLLPPRRIGPMAGLLWRFRRLLKNLFSR